MPPAAAGSGSEEDARGGQTDAKRKRKLKKEHKKEKMKQATMATSASDEEEDEEDRRLQKKLRKLLKRQRQQQRQQPQPTPPEVPLETMPPPRPKPAFVPAISTGPTNPTQEELWRRAERERRFASEKEAATSASSASAAPRPSSSSGGGGRQKGNEEDRGGGGGGSPLVGTCRVVERDYTRTVDPRDVRPVPVLEEALRRVQAHWAAHEEYPHACSGLKSIRQDLRVQHVETPFTVKVYETHARIALEAGDLNEFLLCAARLDELRAQGLPTAADEFAAYRLLHALYLGDPLGLRSVLKSVRGGGADCTAAAAAAAAAAAVTRGGKNGSGDCRDASSSSALLDRGQGKGEASSLAESAPVRHALEVLRAHVQGNFLRFFRLYQRAPHMSAYLMDFLLLRTRRAAVETAVAAYGPTSLSLPMLAQTLAFDDVEECRAFAVSKMGCIVLPDDPLSLDVRASRRMLLGSGKGDDGGGGKRRKGRG